MTITFIALGSNLDNPSAHIKQAFKDLGALPKTTLIAHSSLYESMPLGPQNQPNFINAAATLETDLEPLDLLAELQKIEHQHGRIKKRHWGERTLDLDIALYGDAEFHHPDLTIPHKALKNRAFVLQPIIEINADVKLPDGQHLKALLAKLDKALYATLQLNS
jgi:2-amino-4-hydroxy-6-hydroxymethyldihydropteridine diphosphokinase